MAKSKALIMAESGKERLCYDACRRCVIDDIMRDYVSTGEIDDEYFGGWFIRQWENKIIACPIDGQGPANPYEDPPEACPYILEHTMIREK